MKRRGEKYTYVIKIKKKQEDSAGFGNSSWAVLGTSGEQKTQRRFDNEEEEEEEDSCDDDGDCGGSHDDDDDVDNSDNIETDEEE